MASLWIVVVATLLLAQSSNAETCTIDPSNPESMKCDAGFSSTLFTTTNPVVASGLSYDFYKTSCPSYEDIIKSMVTERINTNPLHAVGVVRIMFHDCFIQGCDASLLLNGSSSEQNAIPNLALRQESFQFLADIKTKLEETCPETVSCADLISVTAAEAIYQFQGPSIKVPVGRRDSTTHATDDYVLTHLPGPNNNVSQMLPHFTFVGLDYKDLVALSGAHTLGQSHCSAFTNRLRPVVDSTLDDVLASKLIALCPNTSSSNSVTIAMDSTPTVFDNKYFKQLQTGDVLFTSDEALGLDNNTKNLAKLYAKNQKNFNAQFVLSFLKMSQINTLVGSAGEVRTCCSINNFIGSKGY